jgi:hypothetical protein
LEEVIGELAESLCRAQNSIVTLEFNPKKHDLQFTAKANAQFADEQEDIRVPVSKKWSGKFRKESRCRSGSSGQ